MLIGTYEKIEFILTFMGLGMQNTTKSDIALATLSFLVDTRLDNISS